MARTGSATLPLHGGKAPRWLFSRMAALSREITYATVRELGRDAFLERLSDPGWFQALGCVLGFDWHSSGVTTTVTGALKEGLRGMEAELGVYMAGGKGAASRRTPAEIALHAGRRGVDPSPFIYASRMSAKVDNTAIQDGYQLYHHFFVFTPEGRWAVIQQGMNPGLGTARRYHWYSEAVSDFVVEPHRAVCCDLTGRTLNLAAAESGGARRTAAELAGQKPEDVMREISLALPRRHRVALSDINPKRLSSVLLKTYERQPADFEALLSVEGVGPMTVRALSLVAELIYGEAPSYRDPARYSFAHGGKDGTPFPVDRRAYDRTIEVMKRAIQSARVGDREKLDAVRRLASFYGEGI